MKTQACIFDLDGTLADTLRDLGASMNLTLESAGLPTHPLSVYRRFVGNGIRALVSRSLPTKSLLREEEMTEKFREIYQGHLLDTSVPYPGIPELLNGLSTTGIHLAVLSNKPDEMTRHITRVLFPDHPFVNVVGHVDGVPRKPDPTSALRLAAEMGVPPEQCAIIGDTPVDMGTAAAAGMRALGVSWGFRGREELLDAGAEAVADDTAGLGALLLGPWENSSS